MSAVKSDLTKRDQGFLATMDNDKRSQWIKMIINRMMQAWQITQFKQLAQKLGLNNNAPSNWLQNLTVPWSAVYLCSFKTGRSLDWLFDGKTPPVEILSPPLPTELQPLQQQVLLLLYQSQSLNLISEKTPNGLSLLATQLVKKFAVHHNNHDSDNCFG